MHGQIFVRTHSIHSFIELKKVGRRFLHDSGIRFMVRHSDVGWKVRPATDLEEKLIRQAQRVEDEGWARYDDLHSRHLTNPQGKGE